MLPLTTYSYICKRYKSSSVLVTSSELLFSNYKFITNEVINKLLINQEVSITQEELEKLKAIPSVKFDLPITDETYPAFIGLVGKPKTKSFRKAGVYNFSHKETGNKYVGSSNSLSRRLEQYFSGHQYINREDSGRLIPLIKKEASGVISATKVTTS